jgi:DNA repair exonuclease SbcCD ATPase subunit
MSNRRLTTAELVNADALLTRIRAELVELSGGDKELLFAYRRKIYKELSYDERSKPMVRRRLKMRKREEQGGKCPICNEPLPEKYVVLDRFKASEGYTAENTRLIHPECDVRTQAERRYT